MQWPLLAILATLLVPVLVVIAVVLLIALRRASAARREVEIVAREDKEASTRRFRRLEHDLHFLVDFFRIFARLLGEMHAERQVRMIPQALLRAIVEIYGPEVATVLVRRGSPGGNPEELPRLSVVALHSTRGSLRKVMEFQFGEGQAGIVAERQQVMVRKDFDEDVVASYQRSQVSPAPIATMTVNVMCSR